MSKPHFIQICCVTILVFSTSSFCIQTHFNKLCDSNIRHEFESRESRVTVSTNQAQESLEHLLAMSQTALDAQSDISSDHTSTTYVEKLVNATYMNHHVARNFYMLRGHGLIQSAKVKARKANLVVAQDGSGNFNTITEAVRASEKQKQRNEKHRFVIYVKAGIYEENIIVKPSMTNLMLVGDGIDATIITNNKNIYEGVLTHDTATVQVLGSGFVAVGITFENTAGPEKQQAIALLSASDLSVFYKCSFKGYQDTLCAFKHRQLYRECDIYGTIDFIFGDASVVFQKCNIYVRKPLPGQQNVITAQGRTSSSSNTGFVIHNSRVIPASELTQADWPVMTYLGRPWRDYARVVYVKCYLDTLIDPAGWLPFIDDSAFDKVFYAEYMNKGRGANTHRRVQWRGYHVLTTDKEVERFSVRNFLQGESWIPQTRVPFKAGI